MTAAVKAMLEQAKRLSPEEQLELAHELLVSGEPSESPEWAASWKTELRARRAAYESGEAVGRPFDDALADAEAELDTMRDDA